MTIHTEGAIDTKIYNETGTLLHDILIASTESSHHTQTLTLLRPITVCKLFRRHNALIAEVMNDSRARKNSLNHVSK
jgi:hypothetical protein